MVDLLRVVDKPVFYAVNKIDAAEQEAHVADFFSLGIEPLFPISAEHRYGLIDFLDALVE
jgi:GTP-binding protein